MGLEGKSQWSIRELASECLVRVIRWPEPLMSIMAPLRRDVLCASRQARPQAIRVDGLIGNRLDARKCTSRIPATAMR
jgi:hypothetical protein